MFPLSLILAQTTQSPIRLDVDATRAPQGVLRVVETLPEVKGHVQLSMPKWIPGEHGATGTMNSVVRLDLRQGGRELAWTRDPKDPFTIRVDVLRSEQPLRAEFAVASNPGDNLAPHLGRVKWNRLVLLPKGDASHITVQPSLHAPEGWAIQTALLPLPNGSDAQFDPLTAERLVDSPAQIGQHAKTIELAPGYWLDLLADKPSQLEVKPEVLASLRSLVTQTRRLFGAKHFRQYRFLCTFSDSGGSEGLEHHESSENGVDAATLRPNFWTEFGILVSHEMFHSWNGKYRRPSGMARLDFQDPEDLELVWMYEGLTAYYARVLAARAGFARPEEIREQLAGWAGPADVETGRAWRSLADIARSADLLRQSTSWRLDLRGTYDYYEESVPMWIEADATIRRLTRGTKSLDDFCRVFYGGRDTGPEVRPYALRDVLSALMIVAPYNWAKFVRERVYAPKPRGMGDGYALAGWRLVYGDKLGAAQPGWISQFRLASTGLLIGDAGTVDSVVLDSPAYRAGIGPGGKIVKVNGKPFTQTTLDEALAAQGPLSLTIERSGETATAEIIEHGGIAYPHLERIQGTADLLSEAFKPL